ncbi:hypothetical protein LJC10_05835, partial [Selenomonadales bacterium OttesenSCG-928-I06]|nr:hypothetical protein [Selenomonadales bacterium OttesenSCG-928-I06]
ITILGDVNKSELMLLYYDDSDFFYKYYIKKEDCEKLFQSESFIKNKDFEITLYGEIQRKSFAEGLYKGLKTNPRRNRSSQFNNTEEQAIWVVTYDLSYKGGSVQEGIFKKAISYDDKGTVIFENELNEKIYLSVKDLGEFLSTAPHVIQMFRDTNINLVKKYNASKQFKDKIQPDYFETYAGHSVFLREKSVFSKARSLLDYMFEDKNFVYYSSQKDFFIYTSSFYNPKHSLLKYLRIYPLLIFMEPKNKKVQKEIQEEVSILLANDKLEIIEGITDKEIWLVAELLQGVKEDERLAIKSKVYYNKNGEIVYMQPKGFETYYSPKENLLIINDEDKFHQKLIENIKSFLAKKYNERIKAEKLKENS